MLGEKYFLWNSIPNLIWIFGLVYYLFIRKSIGAVMVAMFVYLSLHGGYAIFAAATGDGINTLNALHYESSDLGVKLVGASFLIYCSVLLGLRMQNPLESIQSNFFFGRGISLLLIFFLASMVYGAINLPGITSGKLQTVLKESIFSVGMWVGILIFSIVIKQGQVYFISCRKEWFSALIILGVIMIASGFYEIVTGVIWAGTYYETGFSHRTSGTLFNPNVLGFWCALMVALISLLFHLGWISRRITFGAMVLVLFVLILSSSRTGFMLSMVNLFSASAVLLLNRKVIRQNSIDRAWPAITFFLAFVLCAVVIEYSTPSPSAFLNTLHSNLYRFLRLPVDIFWIFVMQVFSPAMQKLQPLLASLLEWLPVNGLTEKIISTLSAMIGNLTKNIETVANSYEAGKMIESVNGRMLLEYISDNSFMSIYAIGGVTSLAIWLWLWGMLFWIGIKKNRSSPGVFSAYALTGLIFCFASGLFLRTPQLFPVWIFLSMVLGACLCWWSSAGPNSSAAKADFSRWSPAGPAKALYADQKKPCAS